MPSPRKYQIYPVPRAFQPLIDAEVKRLGCYTYTDCMGQILADYFSRHPIEGMEQPETNKEVEDAKTHDRGSLPRVQAKLLR